MVDSNTMKNRMQTLGNQVTEAATSAAAGVSAMADDVGRKAKELAADAAQRAEIARAYLSQRAEDATEAVGEHLKAAGCASESMGRSLRETGAHLEREGVQGLVNDMTTLMRRNPIATLCAGVAIGFCMARTFSHHE